MLEHTHEDYMHIALAEANEQAVREGSSDERTIPLFAPLTKVLVLAVGIYVMLQVWRVDATAWLASLPAAS